MKDTLLALLIDPVGRGPLQLEAAERAGDEIVSGRLRAAGGAAYAIAAAIPRFVLTDDPGQQRTSAAFGYKWRRRDTYDSPAVKASSSAWMSAKYGFDSLAAWARYYDSRERILDVGCGSGFSSSLWLDTPAWTGRAAWVGVDISAAIDVARERLAERPNTHFVQADALQLPFAAGTFDTIFSEGVLHHTPSTRAALLSAAHMLAPGGEFLFYVYRSKGPVREFTDDYVRTAIADLADRKRPGRPCARSRGSGRRWPSYTPRSTSSKTCRCLGIPAGEHDVQRLVYWHFAKLFWNETCRSKRMTMSTSTGIARATRTARRPKEVRALVRRGRAGDHAGSTRRRVASRSRTGEGLAYVRHQPACFDARRRCRSSPTTCCADERTRSRTVGPTARASGLTGRSAWATAGSRSSTCRPPATSRCATRRRRASSRTTASSTTSASCGPSCRRSDTASARARTPRSSLHAYEEWGDGVPRAFQRHVRVRRLGPAAAAPVPCPRPLRDQAALLLLRRRHVPLRLGDQGAPGVPGAYRRGVCIRRPASSTSPSRTSSPTDAVRRRPPAAAGLLAQRRSGRRRNPQPSATGTSASQRADST